jgi:hypothetical protein
MKNRCCMKTTKGRGVVCVGGIRDYCSGVRGAAGKTKTNNVIRTALVVEPQELDPEDEH